MFNVFQNRLELAGILTTVTALRISQGRSAEPIGSDLPVVKDALGRPFIPGSSFKGALRSRLESFLRGIVGNHRKLVADPALESEWSLTAREIQNLKAQHGTDAALTAAIVAETDLVSRLFGSPWIASKFQVRDLTVLPDAWFGQYQERDGVAIDRDTETAAEGKLYDFQVVPAGTPFHFQVVVENAEDWELGLLMIGLHQFETEQIPLGGGRSRGLGVVKLDLTQTWWMDYPEDQPEQLLRYLQRLVAGEKDHYQLNLETFAEHKQDWVQSLIAKLTEEMQSSQRQSGSTTTVVE
ncbi:CRISPR-associated RAMP protein [Synechococcales cyanobacterium C]|uniref:CRISPR-associated RAMP protein n=1 Tax=Petrachloros mirabilis ULC683 TaxID=2781853 RepID=A0A8K2A848_9CYAN|nr:CRISPR-associated RAMP protein Csx7 [Petrachloros mirabilis]NCJ07624.1 CRISPR-associated RAMP protein [Petrachloros mirabilis ULC683]